MIDISDGLAIDLAKNFQASGVGASLDAAAIPIHADALKLAHSTRKAPLEHALSDGEDHELLFTTASRPASAIHIGRITAARSLVIREDGAERPLPAKGWDHSL